MLWGFGWLLVLEYFEIWGGIIDFDDLMFVELVVWYVLIVVYGIDGED